jgi:ATP-dependent helicase/nuclease subunit A
VDGRVIAGSIDRLLVGETVVRVIDFKTGAHVPDGEAAVPIGYLRQMGAYVAALAVIFPGRTIEAALLFTGGPRLIALSDAMIAAHKPDFAEGKAKLAAAS